jgi:hypothetical protein
LGLALEQRSIDQLCGTLISSQTISSCQSQMKSLGLLIGSIPQFSLLAIAAGIPKHFQNYGDQSLENPS